MSWSRFHWMLSGAVVAVAAVLAVGFFVHFSWNMFAPDVFGLPRLEFRNALGMTILAAALSFIVRPRRRHALQRSHSTPRHDRS